MRSRNWIKGKGQFLKSECLFSLSHHRRECQWKVSVNRAMKRFRIILCYAVIVLGLIAWLPLKEIVKPSPNDKNFRGSSQNNQLVILVTSHSGSVSDAVPGTISYSSGLGRSSLARNKVAPMLNFKVPYSTQGWCCVHSKNLTVQDILAVTVRCSKQYRSCTCQYLLFCKVVVLTALSDNHYREALDFIGSAQRYLPHRPIIVYDLGLNSTNLKSLKSFCNVYIKPFKFEEYPEHVKNLKTYAWKPLIINETLPEGYEIILWCDSSCRFSGYIMKNLHYLTDKPIIPGPQGGHPFITAVHEGMKDYLGLKSTRRQYSSIDISLQVVGILWFNRNLREHFLNYWVDCALHRECIAPLGARAHPCNGSLYGKLGTYANCHRFDQSAYNAILTREYGMQYTRFLYSKRLLVISIVRKPKKLKYKIRKC